MITTVRAAIVLAIVTALLAMAGCTPRVGNPAMDNDPVFKQARELEEKRTPKDLAAAGDLYREVLQDPSIQTEDLIDAAALAEKLLKPDGAAVKAVASRISAPVMEALEGQAGSRVLPIQIQRKLADDLNLLLDQPLRDDPALASVASGIKFESSKGVALRRGNRLLLQKVLEGQILPAALVNGVFLAPHSPRTEDAAARLTALGAKSGDPEAMLFVSETYVHWLSEMKPGKERDMLEQRALEQLRSVKKSYMDTDAWRATGAPLLDRVMSTMDERHKHQINYRVMDFLVMMTGRFGPFSYWFALILLSVVVKLALTPLQKKWLLSMKEMQKLGPEIAKLKEKYRGQELNEKTMALYKERGVNPMSGCLPMLIQFPILIYIYNTIRMYEYQFSKGTFLWISDWSLSHKYPAYVGSNLGEHDLLLLVLYGVSMFVTQRMTPVSDPAQAEQMKNTSLIMTIFFFYMMYTWHFPSAFVFYWLVFNVISTAQQIYLMRDHTPQAALAVAGGGGSRKTGKGAK